MVRQEQGREPGRGQRTAAGRTPPGGAPPSSRRATPRPPVAGVAVALLTALVGVVAAPATPAGAVDPPGTILNIAPNLSDVAGMVTGPDGNLWFTNGDRRIGRITPAGVITNFTDPAIDGPRSITVGPDGNLWFTNFDNDSIGRITPAGVVTSFTDPSIDGPCDITAGPDGNLWFTNGLNSTIGRITPAGVITNVADPGIAHSELYSSITTGPDGNLWFTNDNSQSIGRMTTAGLVTTFALPSNSMPRSIATGPDGNLWFVDDPEIKRITPAGIVTAIGDTRSWYAHDLTAGPDGNLWFTRTEMIFVPYGPSSTVSSIGRLTPAGSVTEFTGFGIDFPSSITTGPDGNIWFANHGDSSIMRATPAGVVTTVAEADIADARALTSGSDDGVWFTNRRNDSIGRIAADETITTFTGTDVDEPGSVTTGPDGALWFTNNGSIGQLAPDGTFTFHPLTDGATSSTPGAITSGPDGNLWFTIRPHCTYEGYCGDGSIGRVTPAGALTTFASSAIRRPTRIASGPDGNVWFVDSADGSVATITASGQVTTIATPGADHVWDLTTGPDGNLWFTDRDHDAIGRLTPAGQATMFTDPSVDGPDRITAGPDGSLWFTNNRNDSIGRITPAGVITAYTDPTVTEPEGITVGPDGNIWFINDGDDSIGRIIVEPPAPGATAWVLATPGDAEATVLWAPTLLGGAPATDYAVISDPGGHTCTTTGALTCTVTGLTNGIPYTFTVTAGNAVETGPPSAPSAPVTPLTVPDPPTSVTATPTDQAAAVTWAAPTSAGGTPVTGYTATSDPGGHTCTTTGALTCTVTGLTNGVPHTFTVTATNAVGDSAPSAPSAPVVPTVCAGAEGAGPFTDVATDHPFCVDIEWLRDAGIAGGYPDGTFGPTNPVARQTLSVFLWRHAGEPTSTRTKPFFADVPATHPFFDAIQWMADTGLASGVPNPAGGDPLYQPYNPVTRQTLATFLWRYDGEPDTALTEPFFADVPATHPFFGAIQWMADTGLASGVPNPAGGDPLYQPSNPVTRQTMAAFLHRYDER